jgi:hypothetical protein
MVINQRMGVKRNKLLPARSLWTLISKVRRLEGDTVDGSEINRRYLVVVVHYEIELFDLGG